VAGYYAHRGMQLHTYNVSITLAAAQHIVEFRHQAHGGDSYYLW
jgi:hypothetical protein